MVTSLAGPREEKVMNVLEKAIHEMYDNAYSQGRAEARAAREKEGEARLAAMMLKAGRYSLEEIIEMTGLNAEQIGEAEGILKGMSKLAAKVLKTGKYSLDEILELTGLTAEQVNEAAAACADKTASDVAT